MLDMFFKIPMECKEIVPKECNKTHSVMYVPHLQNRQVSLSLLYGGEWGIVFAGSACLVDNSFIMATA